MFQHLYGSMDIVTRSYHCRSENCLNGGHIIVVISKSARFGVVQNSQVAYASPTFTVVMVIWSVSHNPASFKYSKPRISLTRVNRIFAYLGSNFRRNRSKSLYFTVHKLDLRISQIKLRVQSFQISLFHCA